MYDSSIRYMGPQGKLEWLFEYIPPIPPGCQELDEPWNKVFYGHDLDYECYIPWWRFLKRYLAMKDRLHGEFLTIKKPEFINPFIGCESFDTMKSESENS